MMSDEDDAKVVLADGTTLSSDRAAVLAYTGLQEHIRECGRRYDQAATQRASDKKQILDRIDGHGKGHAELTRAVQKLQTTMSGWRLVVIVLGSLTGLTFAGLAAMAAVAAWFGTSS